MVQGVFFRKHTQEKAISFSLMGQVRNLPDESVEILAKGDGRALMELEKWCESGSPLSKVDQVSKTEIDHEEVPQTNFKIGF